VKPVIVTTSWDDGHKLDLKLAALLREYGIEGTFYISPRTREFSAEERLTADEILALSDSFEIGAHTMTHPHLTQLDAYNARQEIAESKEVLECITNKPVQSFAYPYGEYNDAIKQLVKEAGFRQARSVSRFMTRSVDRYAMGTSVDTFDHRRDGLTSILRLCERRPWRIFNLRRWDSLAKLMFAQARLRGEVFHLWGHARDIERHDDWQRLEVFLAWLATQKDIAYSCNADVPSPKPRALITMPYFKPNSGGLEEYCYQIAKGLQADKNWQVAVVSSGRDYPQPVSYFQGLKTYRLPYSLMLSNTPFGFTWPRRLKHIITAEQPDIIIGHAPVPGMIDVTARQAKKVPFVVTYHYGSMLKDRPLPDVFIRFYESWLLPLLLRKSSGVIVTSDYIKSWKLMQPYIDKTIVIKPAVDVDIFTPKHKPEVGRNIMHVGGLKPGEEHKGLRTSLLVTAKLKAAYPDVKLVVVGNGSRLGYFSELAYKFGISEHVDFRGRLTGQELARAYQAADILIVPSRTEAYGMVVIEAMACGVPVVASATGGIPEIITDNESGFLVSVGDVDEFASKISRLFEDRRAWVKFSETGMKAASVLGWSTSIQLTVDFLTRLGVSENFTSSSASERDSFEVS
jgi:peptidoglycan-N-acetylglucosamine deacetylase